MVEALKCCEDAEAFIVDFKCDIKSPHQQNQTYRMEAVCKLPEKSADDSDDDEDFGEMMTFSDSGMQKDPDAEDVELFLFSSVTTYDSEGKSPLDYATYFCHKEASEFLREIQGGKLTRHEEKVLLNTVVKMQSLRRGNVDRMAVMGIRAMAKGKAAPKTAAEEKAAGMHM